MAREPGVPSRDQDRTVTMKDWPLVSAILPCFNAERYVAGALESLRTQTYSRLEILVLDDGSSDRTFEIVEQHRADDVRIRVLRNSVNLGLTATLNRGVAEAHGDVIARMDADDLAAPLRLAMQVEALKKHPSIGLVGTAIELVGERGRWLRPRPLRCYGPGGARFMALLGTPMAHVTLAARADVLRSYPYDESPGSAHTEDYELFSRMLSAGIGFMNLPQALVRVRVDPRGVSLRNEQLQVSNFAARALDYFTRTLGFRPTRQVHRVLVNRIDAGVTPEDLAHGLHLLDQAEQTFLDREPDAADDIRRAADLQRVDILVQAAARWSHLRAAAGALAVKYRGRLASPASRRYLASKLPFQSHGRFTTWARTG